MLEPPETGWSFTMMIFLRNVFDANRTTEVAIPATDVIATVAATGRLLLKIILPSPTSVP
jgi:hypothetical protein